LLAAKIRKEGILTVASVTVATVFLVALSLFVIIALIVQRDHVGSERERDRGSLVNRVNAWCERRAPGGVDGWTADWNARTETFICVYLRNGQPTGQTLKVRRSDL
jgi:hypothetical protein